MRNWIHIDCFGHHNRIFSIFCLFFFLADTSRAGDKYETIATNSGYSRYMKLRIRNITQQDFGSYRCVAKNSLGETDGYIKLDGKFIIEFSL